MRVLIEVSMTIRKTRALVNVCVELDGRAALSDSRLGLRF